MTEPLYDIVMNAFAAGMAQGVKNCEPKRDLIARKQAEELFGKAWIKRIIDEKKVDVHRNSDKPNSKYYLSYAALQAVRSAETICHLVWRDRHKKHNQN